MTDAPRLLARRSELGYVRYGGLADEPEAVSEAAQMSITAAAARAAHDRQRAEWEESRDRLQRELDWLYSRRFAADVGTQLAALARQIDRIDQRLGRPLKMR